jgi:hypothetical protein
MRKIVINLFEERNFFQPMGSAISFQGALVFFLLSFGCRVRRLEVGGEVFFSSCIWCGEWIVQCPFGHRTLDFPCKFYCGHPRGARFIFLSTNRKAQGALFLFLLT